MKDIQITDAELELMKILWENPEGLSSSEIRGKLSKDWERTTVLTLLSRLSEKGAVRAEKENRSYRYTAQVSRQSYSAEKTQSLLDTLFDGSIRGMMAALCDSRKLTEEELRELQELIERGGL